MVALFIDFVGGWLAGRYLTNLFICILCALLSGVVASIGGAFLIYLIAGDVFSEREVAARALGGLIWHPLIALVVALVVRRKQRKPRQIAT